jgi:hypothetical protein
MPLFGQQRGPLRPPPLAGRTGARIYHNASRTDNTLAKKSQQKHQPWFKCLPIKKLQITQTQLSGSCNARKTQGLKASRPQQGFNAATPCLRLKLFKDVWVLLVFDGTAKSWISPRSKSLRAQSLLRRARAVRGQAFYFRRHNQTTAGRGTISQTLNNYSGRGRIPAAIALIVA